MTRELRGITPQLMFYRDKLVPIAVMDNEHKKRAKNYFDVLTKDKSMVP